MSIGFFQILVIVLVVVLLFGAGRVPRMMEDLGKGIKSFKKGLKDDDVDPPKIDHKDDQING